MNLWSYQQMNRIIMAMAAALFAVSCGVQANPDDVKRELAKKFPDLKVERITKTNFGGLYEVFTGTELFYADEKATFVLTGDLIETATRANVSQARLTKLTAIDFDALPFQHAIKMVRGDGSRRMAIFEDPLCGFCKKFEADMATINNVTAYVFLYPILAQDSHVKSKNIWCAKDRALAWQDWMLRDKVPGNAAAECQTPVDEILALGQRFNIRGTPVTFFEDGERVVGAQPVERFEEKLKLADRPEPAAKRPTPVGTSAAPATKK
jgi:thiol:disulfide interchange protein DsbC